MVHSFTIRQHLLYYLIILGIFAGCNANENEGAVQKREMALRLREQQLDEREAELDKRAAELTRQRQLMDSATQPLDTLHTPTQNFSGIWNVQMTCTETTCPGSAVGDTKTEQWVFTKQVSTIVVKAMASGQVVRVYTGTISDGLIELTEERAAAVAPNLSKMVVRLKPVNATHMEGEREIVRESNCRILYTLQLDAAK